MPIYEFKCEKCGCVFEKLVPVTYTETPACTGCGDCNVKKLFSPFGFALGGKTSMGKTSAGGGCSSCSSANCSTCGH